MKFSIHKPADHNKVNIHKTYSHKNTCPSTCALKNNGCYADNFHVNQHWTRITDGRRGIEWDELLDQISILPARTLWRHNVAGDLVPEPDNNANIDADKLAELVAASKRRKKRGFTYTHHILNAHNVACLNVANREGFTINASTDNVRQATTAFKRHHLPTVTVLPMDAPNDQTIDGVRVVACPADTKPVKCDTCAPTMCANKNRQFVIGFRAHGTKKKNADIIARTL